MDSKLLQRGDIIQLEKGMKVYAELPRKYIFSNCPFDSELSKVDVTIGKKYIKNAIFKDNIVTAMFEKLNGIAPVPMEKVVALVDSLALNLEREELDTSFLAGKYTVIFATLDGGSYDRPNGWHVFCKKVDSEIEVDFYQTGYFTAMIKHIMPLHE